MKTFTIDMRYFISGFSPLSCDNVWFPEVSLNCVERTRIPFLVGFLPTFYSWFLKGLLSDFLPWPKIHLGMPSRYFQGLLQRFHPGLFYWFLIWLFWGFLKSLIWKFSVFCQGFQQGFHQGFHRRFLLWCLHWFLPYSGIVSRICPGLIYLAFLLRFPWFLLDFFLIRCRSHSL